MVLCAERFEHLRGSVLVPKSRCFLLLGGQTWSERWSLHESVGERKESEIMKGKGRKMSDMAQRKRRRLILRIKMSGT